MNLGIIYSFLFCILFLAHQETQSMQQEIAEKTISVVCADNIQYSIPQKDYNLLFCKSSLLQEAKKDGFLNDESPSFELFCPSITVDQFQRMMNFYKETEKFEHSEKNLENTKAMQKVLEHFKENDALALLNSANYFEDVNVLQEALRFLVERKCIEFKNGAIGKGCFLLASFEKALEKIASEKKINIAVGFSKEIERIVHKPSGSCVLVLLKDHHGNQHVPYNGRLIDCSTGKECMKISIYGDRKYDCFFLFEKDMAFIVTHPTSVDRYQFDGDMYKIQTILFNFNLIDKHFYKVLSCHNRLATSNGDVYFIAQDKIIFVKNSDKKNVEKLHVFERIDYSFRSADNTKLFIAVFDNQYYMLIVLAMDTAQVLKKYIFPIAEHPGMVKCSSLSCYKQFLSAVCGDQLLTINLDTDSIEIKSCAYMKHMQIADDIHLFWNPYKEVVHMHVGHGTAMQDICLTIPAGEKIINCAADAQERWVTLASTATAYIIDVCLLRAYVYFGLRNFTLFESESRKSLKAEN